MKKTILGLFAFVCAFSGISCSEDDLSGTSVIKPEQTTETPLDAWLYKNYIEPYNIEFRYRYEDMESDMIYDLTPANYEKSVQMAKLVKHRRGDRKPRLHHQLLPEDGFSGRQSRL